MINNTLKKFVLLKSGIALLVSMLISIGTYATHLRAGDIVAVKDNCNSRVFIITITVYVDTDSGVEFGGTKISEGDLLNFGDGTPSQLVPAIGPKGGTPSGPGFSSTYTVIDAAQKIARATYTIYHEYPGNYTYKISYREPNRNEGVLNMDQSVNTQFYLETIVNLDPYVGCSNTPNLLIPPIDKACVGSAWFHNPGAYDPDGDSLSYRLVTPNQETDQNVFNYKSPDTNSDKPKFYLDYEHGNEGKNGRPKFFQDPISGTITWDAPGAVGEYNIAFEIIEWRKLRNGVWTQIGFVRRDMQIIVDDCDNKRPDLIIPKDTCVVAGSIPPLRASILGFDPDNDKVKIEAFSEIFNFSTAQFPATYTPNPPFFQSANLATLNFEWYTKCSHVKDQPYQVTFKITDKPANGGVSLATFKTWFIKVVGPAPEWKEPILDLNKRETKLEWSPYYCETAAETMQVWRRVGEFPFEPDNCQTGMPTNLGYELIATVPIKTINTYIDNNGGKGLAPGARYCYRLVAIFPLPRGGESYVSLDTCVGPILADVPVITNVSVDKTDLSEGEIMVRWQKPFDADTLLYPLPYHYKIFRAVGSDRGNDSINVNPVGIFYDTTFIDKSLNTEENFYNYSVAAYTPDSTWVGTSATASSVRLETKSQNKKIELNWSAFVPWSNVIPPNPNYEYKHELYRGNEGDAPEDFVLIKEVDVSTDGFTYTDEGLEDNKVYCYRVQTKGGYDNGKIPPPLENYSQVICTQPGDDTPPCQLLPPLRSTLDFIDCNDYRTKDSQCDRNTYSNTIFWNKPTDSECRSDVSSYNVYASSKVGDTTFVKIANVKDTFYIDTNLLSFARCYKIAAVDRSNNEGKKSDALCIDNCPYYELPNVFTPNDDDFNDEFSAYSARNPIDCGEANCIDVSKCARFVISVKAKIYNRWGKEVYDYEGHISDEVNTIYIDWNGKDNKGNDLSPAVYYYIAEVTFDTVDPAKAVKTFKGWIHLLR